MKKTDTPKMMGWHMTVRGKRNAAKLAKMFGHHMLITEVEEIFERIGDEMPRSCGRYMVLVHNPGIQTHEFFFKCDRIFAKYIKEQMGI